MITLTLPYPISAPGVYRITDAGSGRFYIGSSVNVAKRWKQHQHRLGLGTHPNPALQAIWNKDRARLRIETIAGTAGDRASILAAEQAALDAAGIGSRRCLNVLAVAGSHLGRKRTEATRKAMAEAQRGRTATPEARARMRAAKLGKPLSEAHRKKLGDAARGKKINRPKGIASPLRSLTADQVRELRRQRADGLSWRLLGLAFGMHRSAAKRAAIGESYAEVQP